MSEKKERRTKMTFKKYSELKDEVYNEMKNFISEFCIMDPDARILRTELKSQFNNYLQDKNIQFAIENNDIVEMMYLLYGNKLSIVKPGGKFTYHGITSKNKMILADRIRKEPTDSELYDTFLERVNFHVIEVRLDLTKLTMDYESNDVNDLSSIISELKKRIDKLDYIFNTEAIKSYPSRMILHEEMKKVIQNAKDKLNEILHITQCILISKEGSNLNEYFNKRLDSIIPDKKPQLPEKPKTLIKRVRHRKRKFDKKKNDTAQK